MYNVSRMRVIEFFQLHTMKFLRLADSLQINYVFRGGDSNRNDNFEYKRAHTLIFGTS